MMRIFQRKSPQPLNISNDLLKNLENWPIKKTPRKNNVPDCKGKERKIFELKTTTVFNYNFFCIRETFKHSEKHVKGYTNVAWTKNENFFRFITNFTIQKKAFRFILSKTTKIMKSSFYIEISTVINCVIKNALTWEECSWKLKKNESAYLFVISVEFIFWGIICWWTCGWTWILLGALILLACLYRDSAKNNDRTAFRRPVFKIKN